jgi:dipeptidyl aminopeptidase/acylaminoacyl peptidase
VLGHPNYHNLTTEDYTKMVEVSVPGPIKIPCLQFLGGRDRRVPFRQGLLFDAITKKTGTPIQTFVYENAGHSLNDCVETGYDFAIKAMLFLEGIPMTG